MRARTILLLFFACLTPILTRTQSVTFSNIVLLVVAPPQNLGSVSTAWVEYNLTIKKPKNEASKIYT